MSASQSNAFLPELEDQRKQLLHTLWKCHGTGRWVGSAFAAPLHNPAGRRLCPNTIQAITGWPGLRMRGCAGAWELPQACLRGDGGCCRGPFR